ncbi:MAG: hypothetical protein ACREQ9_05975 [Candidatus Binatia bacterium]
MPETLLPPRWVIAVSLGAAASLLGDGLLYAVLPVVWREVGLELWMVGVLLPYLFPTSSRLPLA